MERATHTPGPWDYVPYGFDTLAIFANYNAPACDWVKIAQITNDPGAGKDSQSQANARLITAAPELLAILRELLRYGVDSWDALKHYDAVERARAAIAKAEGR